MKIRLILQLIRFRAKHHTHTLREILNKRIACLLDINSSNRGRQYLKNDKLESGISRNCSDPKKVPHFNLAFCSTTRSSHGVHERSWPSIEHHTSDVRSIPTYAALHDVVRMSSCNRCIRGSCSRPGRLERSKRKPTKLGQQVRQLGARSTLAPLLPM